MGSRVATVVLLVVPATTLAEPSFVGVSACAECHAEQAQLHAQSAHALSLAKPMDHPLAERFSRQATVDRDGRFEFVIGEVSSRLEIIARDAERSEEAVRIVADWAFGAGDQAVTFVSHIDEAWYLEHHWSFYSGPGEFATTPGHQGPQADDLGQAVGVRYRTFSPRSEIFRCFRCHSTGPLSLGEEMAIQPSELGVRCESCHGPGSDHVQAIVDGRASEAAALIKNPGRLAPRDLIAHCGTCHRPPASEPHEVDFSDPWNTRHQPVYFTQSRCFQESDELTCMTCHDPHGRVLRNAAGFYRNRCLGCHADESRSPAAACGEPSQADCANCHMPKVQPHEHLAFTNHWIGVFDNPDSLVPRRSAR